KAVQFRLGEHFAQRDTTVEDDGNRNRADVDERLGGSLQRGYEATVNDAFGFVSRNFGDVELDIFRKQTGSLSSGFLDGFEGVAFLQGVRDGLGGNRFQSKTVVLEGVFADVGAFSHSGSQDAGVKQRIFAHYCGSTQSHFGFGYRSQIAASGIAVDQGVQVFEAGFENVN